MTQSSHLLALCDCWEAPSWPTLLNDTIPHLELPSALGAEAPQRGSEWGWGNKGWGKAHRWITSPHWMLNCLPFPSPGASPGLARTTHGTGHKASKRPPWSAAPGNRTPAMSHPLHELQAPLGPNVLPEQTDTPVSWRQGEVLHLELFFSHSRFSASLENVAILIVRCHWSHASWWNRTWKAGRWR